MTWRDYLKPSEVRELERLKDARKKLTREYRRIFDRARARLYRAGTKQAKENAAQNAPATPQDS